MVRVWDVTLAEVEYFVREDRKDRANCTEVAHLQLPLSRSLQRNAKFKKLGLELPEFELAELGLRCAMARWILGKSLWKTRWSGGLPSGLGLSTTASSQMIPPWSLCFGRRRNGAVDPV